MPSTSPGGVVKQVAHGHKFPALGRAAPILGERAEAHPADCIRRETQREGLLVLKNHFEIAQPGVELQAVRAGSDLKFQFVPIGIDQIQVLEEWGAVKIGLDIRLQVGEAFCQFDIQPALEGVAEYQ